MNNRQSVFNIDPETGNFKGDYWRVFVQQYVMYVGTLSDSSNARRTFHTLFISINTMIFAGIAFVGSNEDSAVSISRELLLFANVFGIIMSFVWWRIIKNYRERNRAILSIISEIEERLPLRLFQSEYKMAGCESSRFNYLVMHSIELWIPWLFSTVHISLGLGIMFGFFRLGVA